MQDTTLAISHLYAILICTENNALHIILHLFKYTGAEENTVCGVILYTCISIRPQYLHCRVNRGYRTHMYVFVIIIWYPLLFILIKYDLGTFCPVYLQAFLGKSRRTDTVQNNWQHIVHTVQNIWYNTCRTVQIIMWGELHSTQVHTGRFQPQLLIITLSAWAMC